MLFAYKFEWRVRQVAAVVVVVLGVWSMNSGWASDFETPRPCARANASPETEADESTEQSAMSPAQRNRPATGAAVSGGFCPPRLTQAFFSDQKAIWSSPWHLHTQDRNWLVPFGVGTLGLIAADNDIMRHFGSTPMAHSNSLSNYGLAALIASGAGLYLRGTASNDDHSREAGFLAGEAAVNGVVVAEAMKLISQRPRPNAANPVASEPEALRFPRNMRLPHGRLRAFSPTSIPDA